MFTAGQDDERDRDGLNRGRGDERGRIAAHVGHASQSGLGDDATRTARQLGRTAANLHENPQSLLFGTGAVPPGPGEPGFVAPAAPR